MEQNLRPSMPSCLVGLFDNLILNSKKLNKKSTIIIQKNTHIHAQIHISCFTEVQHKVSRCTFLTILRKLFTRDRKLVKEIVHVICTYLVNYVYKCTDDVF